MSQVKVYNDDTQPWVEKYRDRVVTIPAQSYIEMPRAEARQLLAQWTPIIKDGAERHLKPKMLRMVEDPEEMAEKYDQPERYSAEDGKRFRTIEGMEAYNRMLKEKLNEPTPRRRRVVATSEAEGQVEGNVHAGL